MKIEQATRLRNVAALAFLGVGVVASRELAAQIGVNCYRCESNNYCRETYPNEIGRTTCIDPNQGWTNCSLGGGICFWGEED
jgi:hypothetical protein